ncbi:unnamed protein product [Closterium sp. NIES-53]
MEAAGVTDSAATTRATDAAAADSTASATIVTRADICGTIASSSLMDGLVLKAKRVEEQEEGEEEAVETVVVAERAEVKGIGKAMFKGADGKMVGLNKLGEHEENGAAAQKQHKGEENPKAAAEEDYGESMWGTIGSSAFSNPTSARGECDWLTLHRRMGHVALPILQQLVKNEMVAGIRVKGEPDEVLGCPTCMQAKFTRYPFSSSEATAKAPLDEVVMDVVGPLKAGNPTISGLMRCGEEEEEVQQVSKRALKLPSRTMSAPWIRVTPQQRHERLHVPATEEEGRGKRRFQPPNRLTYEALGKPAKSALAGAALMVGDDEESEYEECAFAFFSMVEMPREPATLKEALEISDAEEWKKAMESELKSIEENGTWELVELPEGRKAITSKWLFKIKFDADS